MAALQNDLAAAVTAAVPGLAAGANRLAAVGLSLGGDGKLTLDEDKLNAALSGQSGVAIGDVKRLFGITGASDDPSIAYGSGSQVGFAGGAVLADLGFTGSESATGTDVAGHFVVGGQTEAATGAGQVLTGKGGNANTDGLQVRATGSAPGAANVTVTQGLASRLGAVIGKYLDPAAGRFKTITDGLKDQFDDFGRTIVKQNDTLAAKTDALTRRFAAMEAAVNSLKGLQSQLASLIPTSTK